MPGHTHWLWGSQRNFGASVSEQLERWARLSTHPFEAMLQQNFAAFFVSDCTCVFSNCNFTHLWGRCNNSSVPAHKTTTHKTPKNSPDFRFWTMQSLATLLMLSVWSLSPTICSAAFCASGVNLFVSSPLMPNVYRCQRESARSTLRMVEEPLFEERNSRRQVLQNAMVSIALGNSVFDICKTRLCNECSHNLLCGALHFHACLQQCIKCCF